MNCESFNLHKKKLFSTYYSKYTSQSFHYLKQTIETFEIRDKRTTMQFNISIAYKLQ